jgi:hypothetical protein
VEGVAAASAVAHLAEVSPWWFVAGGGAAALAGTAVANARLRHTGTALYTCAACAVAGLAGAAGIEFGPWSGAGLGTLVLGGILLGTPYGWFRDRHDTRVAKQVAKAAEQQAVYLAERKHNAWEDILAKAGAKDVHVLTELNDDVWTNGERKFEAGFALALDLGESAPTARELATYTPKIEQIAARRLKLRIRSGSIEIRPGDYAHEAEIIIPTRDILKETFPMRLLNEPRSVNDPVSACISVDGTPIGWLLSEDPHGMIVGQTNSGKSTFLQALGVELTRCVDNTTWMIVGQKPVRNFAPWLHPFLKGLPSQHTKSGYVEPVIDWVAADIGEACRMLMDAYKAISIRQRKASENADDQWMVTEDSPRITILIDESPDFLNNNTYKVKPYDWTGPSEEDDELSGVRTGLTFSELLLKVVRLARSEGMTVAFLSQRGTNSMVGADAGDLKSQIPFRAGFRQSGYIEQNATFNTETAGVDVATLRQGELFIEMGGFYRPVRAKGYYPDKELIQAAAIQNCQWAQPLDDYTADGLDYYAGRWTRESQQDFLRQVLPSAVRTVPYRPMQAQPEHAEGTVTSATEAAAPEGAPRHAMGAFEQWMGTHHSGEDITDNLFQQFVAETWNAVPPEERAEIFGENWDELTAEQRATFEKDMPMSGGGTRETSPEDEVAMLERMFAADPADEPEPPASPEPPAGPVIDPTLPESTRAVLALLARSDLLYGEWVPTMSIVALAAEELGWEESTPGAKKVKDALAKVNVFQPGRPKIPGTKKKYPSGYFAADIQQALEAVTSFGDEEHGTDEPGEE